MSYIDDLKIENENKKNRINEKVKKESIIPHIIVAIKNNIRIGSNGQPNDIEGYYCESNDGYGGPIEYDIGKDYIYFPLDMPYSLGFDASGTRIEYTVDFSTLKSSLEYRIKNEIGYKYCEVMIEDKNIVEKKYAGGGFFGGDRYDTKTFPAKAIWIHASMNNIGFGKLKEHSPKRLTITYTSHSTIEKKYG